jgi:elongation factor P
MPTLSMNQLKLGTAIEMDGSPWVVISTQHTKVARGGATLRAKLRNLLTNATLERVIQPAETFPKADIVRRKASFLYQDNSGYTFMNSEDFDQFTFTNDQLANKGNYLTEGQEVDVMYFKGNPVAAALPTKVTVTVAETPGNARGDTAGNATKVATLISGAELRVPLFVNSGDKIVVNTETDSYVERA